MGWAKKAHIICGKCGSDETNFVINGRCPDYPQAAALEEVVLRAPIRMVEGK